MPAMACSLDATAVPPGHSLAEDSSLPLLVPFAGVPLLTTTNTAATTAAASAENSHWSVSRSAALYKINEWGAPYFSVNASGNITVRPHGTGTLTHQEIDLLKIVKKVTDARPLGGLGLQLPLIVRFPDVLKNRLESLQAAFDLAIQSEGYDAHYQGVYPVKCNQDRFVVEDIVKFGSPFRFGLEAGSKPELLLAMTSLCKGNAESLLVCNGFKDAEYIYLALVARKLALNSVIVLEEEEELDIVLDVSKRLSVRPVIGMRAKLRTRHAGHFGSTSGEKGKFGLTTTQILRVVKKLKQARMLDCLQLLHFHIGSQIPTTALLADGVGEAAQIYCELVRLGAEMQVFDIGGGLGVDYDGSRSCESEVSVEYGLEEFASAVVQAVRAVCERRSVRHPIICSESGRAIVSHHSVLLFEAISANTHKTPAVASTELQHLLQGLPEDAREHYQNLCAAAYEGDHATCSLFADQLKQRYVDQFKLGRVGLEQLAAVDGLCAFISKAVGTSNPVSTYHINLSIFTSIPDFWGIEQLFPIVPIHRLDKRPTVKGILSDLTCDSDGKIDMFIGGESSLPLHEMEAEGGRYYLGMFLGGAYQEALGGLHNLFGGSTVVRVSQRDGPHSFAVTRAVPGPSCADVLRVMQHQPELMFDTLKQRTEEYIQNDDDDDAMSNSALAAGILTRAFHNMPYLVSSSSPSLPSSINHDNGFFYSNEDDYGVAVYSSAADDIQWSYSLMESLALL